MKTLGAKGEELAAAYLEKQGYTILERNWRCQRGEIDIIAKEGQALVFVEVKTRRTNSLGTPAEAVNFHKQEKLRLLARCYIYRTKMTAPVYRFDVAAVDGKNNEVILIKNAF